MSAAVHREYGLRINAGRSLHLSAARTARKNTRNAETVALVRKAMMSPAAKQENPITSLLSGWSRKRERPKKASPTLRSASVSLLMLPATKVNMGMAQVASVPMTAAASDRLKLRNQSNQTRHPAPTMQHQQIPRPQ